MMIDVDGDRIQHHKFIIHYLGIIDSTDLCSGQKVFKIGHHEYLLLLAAIQNNKCLKVAFG
jgi:hypothetical protein